uniref:ELM2 domain-containing protein n=1 Tax=Panagrellus redivivus TaxID=6233 RepID=A0A7E4ZXB8_PANRE
MISPRKYAVPRRSAEYYANENGQWRRSKRQAAAAGIDIGKIEVKRMKTDDEEVEDKDKMKRAVFADWQQPKKPCEDRDRDELLLDPEQTQKLDHIEVQKYLIAAYNKLGSDTHDHMAHLIKHRGDFKEAMETIDAVDSVPNAAIRGPNGIGIWSKGEEQILITQWNLIREKKRQTETLKPLLRRMEKMKKMLPHKTTANINNAIYWLKVLRCRPRKGVVEPHQFCEKKVHRAVTEPNIRSADCANCREKLWMKPIEEYPDDFGLCSLCMLYHITFKRLRPNAAVTPEVLQFGQLEPCICNGPHNEDSVEALRKCLNKDILCIKGANIEDLFQGFGDMSMSSAVVDLATSSNSDNTYAFVCRKGVETLSDFPRFDLGVPSAAGSDEKAKKSKAYNLELLKICWDTHAYSNKLSFSNLQLFFKEENIDLPEELRKDFEAGKAGGPEPDCMLYGVITAKGRIMPGTDATFAEYFDRVTA